ncbi:MAG: DUF1552 domain-containing protein [Planctomycetota bacterium]
MILKNKRIHRRTMLKGAGVSLALPFLDIMSPLQSAAASEAGPLAGSKRVAFIYTPNGYWQPDFVPQETGTNWALPKSLKPLEPVRSDFSIVTGLDRKFVPGTSTHAQCSSCWLSSAPPGETLDGGFPTDITVDQILARKLGAETMLPSLELSCVDFNDNKETRYYESISWYGPGFAANTENDPQSVFRRLFGKPDPRTASVLDAVLGEASALRGQLGYGDRQKLDEYMASVRATEKRIELSKKAMARRSEPPIPEPKGIPEKRGDYIKLMADLMLLAFQLDLTRVATLVVDPERWATPRMYHDVFDKPLEHHRLTHSKDPVSKQQLAKIDAFHVEQFAYLIERLKQTRNAVGGSLFEETTLVMGSGISDGNRHDFNNLQVLMSGGGIKRGEHFKYEGQRPLADLWLTLLHAHGVKHERFADSAAPVSEILS